MKQSLLTCIIFAVFFFTGIQDGKAQEDSVKVLPAITITSPVRIDKKVTKAFKKTFTNAYDARWYKLNKDYVVKFITRDVENRALYKKSGRLVYHISYEYESSLPDDIRKMIKSNYVEHDITRVVKIKEANRNIWMVNLENDDRYVMVQVEDRKMEEIGNYQKAL